MKESIWSFIGQKIKKIIGVVLKPSFLTWLVITWMYHENKQNIDMNYLIFTASMIGMQKYLSYKKGAVNENS